MWRRDPIAFSRRRVNEHSSTITRISDDKVIGSDNKGKCACTRRSHVDRLVVHVMNDLEPFLLYIKDSARVARRFDCIHNGLVENMFCLVKLVSALLAELTNRIEPARLCF